MKTLPSALTLVAKTLVLASSLALALPAAQAQTIIAHTGATDPLTEGWTSTGSAPDAASAVPDDNGTAAWRVNDTSTASSFSYLKVLSESEAQTAAELGWTLSVTLRVTDANNPPDLTRYVDYVDNINKVRWGMDFGSTIEGNLTVSLRGSALSYTFEDAGYHSFSLVYDSVAGAASLFIDGASTAALTGYTGAADATIAVRHVRWGSTAGTATGAANYHEVSFATSAIPEPSVTATLVGTLALALVCGRRLPRRFRL